MVMWYIYKNPINPMVMWYVYIYITNLTNGNSFTQWCNYQWVLYTKGIHQCGKPNGIYKPTITRDGVYNPFIIGFTTL